MTSPLSTHWIPVHVGDIGGRHDRDWLRAWNPRFVKVVTNDETIPHWEDIPADAKIIVRNYPLSEQGHNRGFAVEAAAQADPTPSAPWYTGSPKDGLVNGPGAFGMPPGLWVQLEGITDAPEMVAAEHVLSHKRTAEWAAAHGITSDRLLFEGINEPMFWSTEPPALVARYEAARLREAHKLGLHLVVLNAGVGWPGNGGVADAPVDWAPFAAMFAEMQPGDYLGLHEYWALNGPTQNWRWWAGRYEQCPAHVPILITECGIDTGVTGQFYGGWRNLPGQMTDRSRRFMDELLWYWGKCWDDGRVEGIFPFTYDRGSDTWIWFDMRNEDLLKEIVLRAGTFAQPKPFAWTTPEPEKPKTLWDAIKTAFGAQCVDVRGKLVTSGAYYQRKLDTIECVVVHHTAASAKTSWAAVAKYHVQTKGWPGIGYHLGITPDGGLSYLGDIADIRYHAGDANADSIGICFAGNYMTDEPTAASLATFAKLLSVIEAYLGRELTVVGHRDVGDTLCPGDNLYKALFVPVDQTAGIREALLAAGRQAEVIALNPDAALGKAIEADGRKPTSPEFTVGIGDGQITAQTARKPGEPLHVYWCWTGDWGNVQVEA